MIALEILGGVLLAAGLAGCLLPVLPGPALSFLALLVLSLARRWQAFSPALLIVMAAFAVLVTVLDYVLPSLISRRRGASRAGTIGSLVGMAAGIVFFPPFGLLLGALAGAVTGELIFNREPGKALRAGWGVFLGSLAGMAVKLAYSGTAIFFYLRVLFRRVPPPS